MVSSVAAGTAAIVPLVLVILLEDPVTHTISPITHPEAAVVRFVNTSDVTPFGAGDIAPFVLFKRSYCA